MDAPLFNCNCYDYDAMASPASAFFTQKVEIGIFFEFSALFRILRPLISAEIKNRLFLALRQKMKGFSIFRRFRLNLGAINASAEASAKIRVVFKGNNDVITF